jgi:tripartite-type tricarboxylate transporter receptor subunit TctC
MTTFTRRGLAALPLAAALPGAAAAQSGPWPNRPPRWIVPWAAGGSSDFVARAVAQAISGSLGQQIVVENRAGGATVPATEFVARQPGDGYTLFSGDLTGLVFIPAMSTRLAYDAQRDLRIVHGMARFPYMVIVHPDVPARTMAEFLALARARQGAVSMSHAGVGSPNHLAVVRLERATGVQFTQVSYRGGAPALQDTIAGVVQSCLTDVASAVGAIQAGRVRAIAACQPTRIGLFPEVPTLAEQGIQNADIYAWNSLCVPSSTPEPIVRRLEAEVARALQDPTLIERFRGLSLETNPMGTDAMAALWRQELATWPPLIRELGITLDS